MKEKVVFCWSGGKDSAMALHKLMQDDRYEIVSLLMTCNERFGRISMHGVRVELGDQQARSIGIPLEKIFMSERSSNEEYQEKMSASMLAHKARGVTAVAFGDIFLEDLKAWRERNLASIGLRGLFPIWKRDTRELMQEFLTLEFGSVICCVNDAYLDQSSLGRIIDREFLERLPADVDPCGEYGEFHSFAFAGPIFKEPIAFELGAIVYSPIEITHPSSAPAQLQQQTCDLPQPRMAKGFWFCDLLPVSLAAGA